MIHDIIILIIGLVLIIAGGNYLTDGAVSIARRMKISQVVIGLTVVAIGSSTPDFVIAFLSTLKGEGGMALGDVVGANIFDTFLSIGVMAAASAVVIDKGMQRKELPMLLLSGLALFVCGDDVLVDGSAKNILTRTDGLMLLGFFVIFMKYTFSMAHNTEPAAKISEPAPMPPVATPRTGSAVRQKSTAAAYLKSRGLKAFYLRLCDANNRINAGEMPVWLAVVLIIGGLAALSFGGNWIVDGASGIARRAGMSQTLIGLTIVAIGSSVPDLSTSLIAALKGQPGLALGNLVGSCVFNAFFIIGLCATIHPLTITGMSVVDFSTLAGGALLLCIFGSCTRRHTITRGMGWVLIAGYAAYMAYLVLSAI